MGVRYPSAWLGEADRNGDPNVVDSDDDGLPDGWEARFGTSATAMFRSEDTDDDGLADGYAP